MSDTEQALSPICVKTARVLSCVLGGLHHLPGKIEDHGSYCSISLFSSNLATFDFDTLTRLVVAAHDECVRVALAPSGPRLIRLLFHDRQREGGMSQRHPTMEQALAHIREYPQRGEDPDAFHFKPGRER